MDFQPLEYIYRPSGKPGSPTLLLLHGTGGNENDLLPLALQFGTDMNVLSLRGNVQEHGMPRFFKRLGMGIFDEKDLEFRTRELVHFLHTLAEKESFDVHNIIALGYSNGANIAGSMLLHYPGLLKGAILYRPMQPYQAWPEIGEQHHTPVFVSNGLQDPTIQVADTRRYVQLMKDSGFDVSAYELPGGHHLSTDDLKLSVDWYRKYFGHGSL